MRLTTQPSIRAASLAFLTLAAIGLDNALAQTSQLTTAATELHRWELASAVMEVPTDHDLKRLAVRHGSRLNGHELALVGEFSSPVDAAGLAEKYAWSPLHLQDGRFVLSATPHDAIEALFVPGFELHFDAETHLPTSIQFDRANRNPATVRIAIEPRLSIDVRTALAASNAESVADSHVELVAAATVAAPHPMARAVAYDAPAGAASPVPLAGDPLPEILHRWQSASTGNDADSPRWRVAGLHQLLHDCEATIIRQSDEQIELQLVRRRSDPTDESIAVRIVLDRTTWLPIDVRPTDAIDFTPAAGP